MSLGVTLQFSSPLDSETAVLNFWWFAGGIAGGALWGYFDGRRRVNRDLQLIDSQVSVSDVRAQAIEQSGKGALGRLFS